MSLIDNTEVVITDSFHVTAFALVFHREFYVYERAYKHDQNQADRITSLLSNIGMTGRYECNDPMYNIETNYSSLDVHIKNIKAKSEKHIGDTIKQFGIEDREHVENKPEPEINLSIDNSKCCGCGMCIDFCPSSAIEMQTDEKGVLYPKINTEKRTKCQACINVCP